jgi:hypothetical protein
MDQIKNLSKKKNVANIKYKPIGMLIVKMINKIKRLISEKNGNIPLKTPNANASAI